MTKMRFAQYGTKHGHARGKALSLKQNPIVEFVGIFEPDQERRQSLAQMDGTFQGVHWFEHEGELLDDPSIIAVASEGRNNESLAQTEAIVRAGKHVWYDKPAGENWTQWQSIVSLAQAKGVYIQMGYMFRYHAGFRQIADWAKSGLLGDVFSIRAHMSTSIPIEQRGIVAQHQGGIFFDLGGHVLDQIVWLLGRPHKITAFLRNDQPVVEGFTDNSLTVYEYDQAMAFIDIAAMEPKPMARRFEVYGTEGSAIMEPMEPAEAIRLCLNKAQDGYQAGVQMIPISLQSRQALYDAALDSFLATIQDKQPPDRSLEHELLVQETLLRATGRIEN